MTSAWLVYRLGEFKLVPFGLYKSKEAAEQEVQAIERALGDDDWEIMEVLMIGWGVANG